APPALGSFTSARDAGRAAPPPAPPADGFPPLPASAGPVDMTMGEFLGRAHEAHTADPSELEGVPVRLTRPVTPSGAGAPGQPPPTPAAPHRPPPRRPTVSLRCPRPPGRST